MESKLFLRWKCSTWILLPLFSLRQDFIKLWCKCWLLNNSMLIKRKFEVQPETLKVNAVELRNLTLPSIFKKYWNWCTTLEGAISPEMEWSLNLLSSVSPQFEFVTCYQSDKLHFWTFLFITQPLNTSTALISFRFSFCVTEELKMKTLEPFLNGEILEIIFHLKP